MKITGCWMYVINKYGFPPKLEDMRKGIKELSDLGFDYIEFEVVGKENLMEVMNNRSNLLDFIGKLGVPPNFSSQTMCGSIVSCLL